MPIRVATRRSSSRSELNSTGPSTMTKLNGGAWSSTHKHAYRSRRSAAPLTEVAVVVNTTSSPSRTNHTGTTCGLPSLRAVATLAVRVPSMTNARHSSSLMWRMSGERTRRERLGEMHARHVHARQVDVGRVDLGRVDLRGRDLRDGHA